MRIFLILIMSYFIVSCAKLAEGYGLYKLTNEEKIEKLVKGADNYTYEGMKGKVYKEKLLSLWGDNELRAKTKKRLLECYDPKRISLYYDQQCTIRVYKSEIENFKIDSLIEKQKQSKIKEKIKWENTEGLILKAKNKQITKTHDNNLFFCEQSYRLNSLVIDDILYSRENALNAVRYDRQPHYIFPLQAEKSFQYRLLQLNKPQFKFLVNWWKSRIPSSMSIDNTGEFTDYLSYMQYCSYNPEKYVINYNKIFED